MESTGWETIRVKTILPQPKSQNWKIFSNEDDYLDINIFDTSLEDYNAYIASCEDYGFEMYIFDNTDENEYECEGYNKYHSEVDINYDFDRQTMHLQLDASIEKNPLKWSTSELAQTRSSPKYVSPMSSILEIDIQSFAQESTMSVKLVVFLNHRIILF